MAGISSVLKVVRHRCAAGRKRYRIYHPENLKKVLMDLLGHPQEWFPLWLPTNIKDG